MSDNEELYSKRRDDARKHLLGNRRGVQVGVGEVLLDAGPEPPHGGCAGNVRGLRLPCTASKKATNTIKSVDNDRPGVTGG